VIKINNNYHLYNKINKILFHNNISILIHLSKSNIMISDHHYKI